MGDKTVSSLISADTSISWTGINGKVTGTLKNITDHWTEFDSDNSNNTGHFFPIELDEQYEGEDITVIGKSQKTVQDRMWVLRAENSNKNKFEFKHNGEAIVNLDLSNTVPMGEKAFDPDKQDFGRFGKWTDYCDGVSIKWSGVKGTVTGTIKKHEDIEGNKVKAGTHFPLALSSYYFDGVPKTITIGSGSPKQVTDKDIICDMSNAKTIKVEYNGVLVMYLDFNSATIQTE